MNHNENVITYNQNDKTLNINGARVTGVSSYSLKSQEKIHTERLFILITQ